MGLFDDTGIDTNQFATLSWLFYLGFLIFEFPHAYMIQRFPTGKYLGLMICLWGACVACTAACNNYASIAAIRFLLGVFESAVSPSLILLTSMFYKHNEQPRRVGFWYIGVGCAVMAGSLMSFGFQHYKGTTFNNWQIMFLVIGLITITIGAIVIVFMPDNPMTARFLTPTERVAATERLRSNNTGIENKHFKPYQLRETLLDPQVWLLSFITTAASIPNGAVSSFQSLLISSFGFNDYETTLLQMPSGFIAAASVIAATQFAAGFNARLGAMIAVTAFGGIIGGSMIAFAPGRATRLVGNYFTQVVGAFLPNAYSLAACNFGGHTKKVTMNAILLMSFCLGNIIGPLTFRDEDAPDFTPAKITIVAVDSAVIVACGGLWGYYRWQNRSRDKERDARVGEVVGSGTDQAFSDLTDRENREVRYKY